MKIEAEWKVSPASGITSIELSDLGCKNKKEWDALDKEEQNARINKALIEYDQSQLFPIVTDWWT